LEQGARGLGELAIYGPADEPAALHSFEDLAGCCKALGGIMLVHANEPVGHWYPGKAPLGLDFYYTLAKLASGVPLILAHWGGGLGFFELLKKDAAETLGNVYYDTAASPFLYKPSIYNCMAATVGVQRILFGSDYPLLAPGRYFREMAEAALSPAEIRAIGGENAAGLFQITFQEESIA
jgi:predicted TIM-barrel fold metal-dependent hydrolase